MAEHSHSSGGGRRTSQKAPPSRRRRRSRRHKKHNLFLTIHRLLVCTLVLALTGALALRFLIPAPQGQVAMPTLSPLQGEILANDSHYQRANQVYTFLLAGSDNGNGNADTIMVVRFDGSSGEVNLVSVPRDTLVYREWSSFPKINAAMSKGILRLEEEVSYTLGIPLDFHVQIGLDGFIALVDALGGLEFDVPQDMYHDDEGGFIIDLKAGVQTLTGRQTLELVRYRGYANADIGRTATQQAVLKALAAKLISVQTLTKLDAYWTIFQEHVTTNLTNSDFMWFAKKVLENAKNFQLNTLTLEGNGSGVYNGYRYCYELDQQKTVDTVNQMLNPYTTPRTLGDMTLLSADNYNS